MDSDWMTPAEAAEVTGMTWRHLLAAADRSLLPAWKFGRKTVRFRPADVHAWAAADPEPPELPTTLLELVLADLDGGDTVTVVADRYDMPRTTVTSWRDKRDRPVITAAEVLRAVSGQLRRYWSLAY